MAIANELGGRCRFRFGVKRGRKVRTPQGSVPDNVRDVSVKAHGRPVPQRIYRLGYLGFRKRTQHPVESLLSARRGKGEKVR